MELLANVVVSSLLETGLERAIEELKRICLVPEEIQKLTTTMKQIKAVLKDAEEKQVSNEAVRDWLRALKQAFLDAEDLVDEITTDAALQPMGAGVRKKLRTAFGSIFKKNSTAHQIQHINGTIEDLASQKNMLGLQQMSSVENRLVEYKRRQPTTSLLADKTSVIGRDNEKKEIKKLLLSSSCEAESSNSMGFSILPIVGMGGLGKTTLARLVYNDEEVMKHFEVKMWVCVSNDFDLTRLTREIIEAAPSDSWESMQQKLRQKVEGKTFLLVLDDVWEVKRSQWEIFFEPLNFAKKGSKIVMTTRLSKAVEINQGLLGQIILRGLSDDDLWSLFERCAFYGCSSSDRSLLEGIGRQIVKRLKGLPLAAKVIGNLLNTRLEVPHWRKIERSELLELEQGEDGILPALRLSYQYLPGNLRQCFAYCSLFPENHLFDKTELTRLWDAQCYSGTEDIGNECFDNLHSRSFFEPSDYGRYVMHDLIHDLAEYVSKDDCFRLDDKKSMEIPETVRHVSVYDTRFDQAQLLSREKLRTLLFSPGFDDMTHRGLDELFLTLKRLRVLGLPYCGISKLPSSVGDLKHLRYINLKGNYFDNLPESLCNLYNLQVLDLRGCSSLVALPTRMSDLINLRHLLVDDEVVDLFSRIDGVGKLTRLQEVTVRGSKVRELGGMGMLRELEINHMEGVGTQEDAVEARLHSKEHLRVLKLEWSPERDAASNNRELDEGTLQALQPADTVKDLTIRGYGGVKSPGWMEDPAVWTRFCLESLELHSCPNWEVLPSLGQLCRLKSLKIKCCPKLWELPPLPPTLERLYLQDVGLTSVLGMWGCRGGGGDGEETSPSHSTSPALAHVSIWSCPNLTSLSGLLHHPLTALTVLKIAHCNEFQSLTERGFGHLVSLKELYITWCPKLNITCSPLVPQTLPSSLQQFELEECGDAMGGWWWEGLHHLTSLAVLSLDGCPTTAASFFLSLGRHPHHRLATTLTKLKIKDCGSSNSVPSSSSPQPSSGGVFRSLTSLETMEMYGSRHLLQEWAGGGLPSSLKKLYIWGDDDLDDGCLATCLRDLTSLTHLFISGCLAITSLPDCLRDLTSLTHLTISLCSAITSIPDCLRDLTSLTHLTISLCPAITSILDCLPDLTSLTDLSISYCSALTSLPGVGVPAAGRRSQMMQLLRVTIESCGELTSLGDFLDGAPFLLDLKLKSCEKLSSLPATLNCLSSLKTLRIDSCPEIESLPEMGLPASLKKLYIRGCPRLKERCGEQGCPDWPKIFHIPNVEIDDERVI